MISMACELFLFSKKTCARIITMDKENEGEAEVETDRQLFASQWQYPLLFTAFDQNHSFVCPFCS